MMPTPKMVCLLLASLGLLSGCAAYEPVGPGSGTPEATVPFEPDAYPLVFDAARDALTDLRFTPDRVDAARGVITTLPKRTAGLASPWDREQSSIGDDGRDLLHQHERTVTIVFDPPESPQAVTVEVTIYRVRRPNWRIEADAIRRSTHAENPAARRAGDEPEFREAISSDPVLAARIAADIRNRAGIGDSPD